jgi:glycosyltransferase involved in cell wall biosynthesis
MVTVSVLMGSYNQGKYLSEAIDSVLNQTFQDFEFIIIDDGSIDNSPQILENYAKKDPRIRAYFHKRNMGIPKTFNECIERAKGKFIAFQNSDDLWVQTKLEKQIAILETNESLIVYSEMEMINENGIPTGELLTEKAKASNKAKSGARVFEEIMLTDFCLIVTWIFKREFTKETKFDEQLPLFNDVKLAVDLLSNHLGFFMNEPLAKYRIHDDNSTRPARKTAYNDLVLLNQYYLKKYGARISRKTKINLLYSAGWGYSKLGANSEARFFFLKAIKMFPSPMLTLRFLIYYLTTERGRSRGLLLLPFAVIDSSVLKLRTRLNSAVGKLSSTFAVKC